MIGRGLWRGPHLVICSRLRLWASAGMHARTHAPTYVDQPGLGYGLARVLDGLVMVSVVMGVCG